MNLGQLGSLDVLKIGKVAQQDCSVPVYYLGAMQKAGVKTLPGLVHAFVMLFLFMVAILLTAATAMFFGLEPQGAVLIGYGFLLTLFLCGIYAGQVQESLQRKYHLRDSPCGPILVHSCLHWCALCQGHREMKGQLADVALPMTVVNPPPGQQMMMTSKIQKQILVTKTTSIQLWKCSLFRTYHRFTVLRIACLYDILL